MAWREARDGTWDGDSFDFSGFFGPVSNPPYVNTFARGLVIPMSFSLGGDRGLAVLLPGSPASQLLDCRTLEPTDPPEPARGGADPSLAYDARLERYTYFWQTEPSWIGVCRLFVLELTDGSVHVAYFRIR